jgi:hypothetical protein
MAIPPNHLIIQQNWMFGALPRKVHTIATFGLGIYGGQPLKAACQEQHVPYTRTKGAFFPHGDLSVTGLTSFSNRLQSNEVKVDG